MIVSGEGRVGGMGSGGEVRVDGCFSLRGRGCRELVLYSRTTQIDIMSETKFSPRRTVASDSAAVGGLPHRLFGRKERNVYILSVA